MIDNDLISRMALYEKTAEWEAQALRMVELHLHYGYKEEWQKWTTILTERSAFKHDIADAPVAPQEMSAREFVATISDMCINQFAEGCTPCPLWVAGVGCGEKILPPEEAVTIVEKWARDGGMKKGATR